MGAPPPPRDLDQTMRRVRIGSMVIEEDGHSGNLLIYTSHTPANQLKVENADVDDLAVAFDAILRHRRSIVTPTE